MRQPARPVIHTPASSRRTVRSKAGLAALAVVLALPALAQQQGLRLQAEAWGQGMAAGGQSAGPLLSNGLGGWGAESPAGAAGFSVWGGSLAPSPALGGWRTQEAAAQAGLLGRPGSGPLAADPLPTLGLLGDYAPARLRLGTSGALRLTGGLLIAPRQTAAASAGGHDLVPTLPYAGIGYSGGGQLGSLASPWGRLGFSADLGLAASGLGLTLGQRGNLLGLGLDGGGLRDWRLTPMLRLGMRLQF